MIILKVCKVTLIVPGYMGVCSVTMTKRQPTDSQNGVIGYLWKSLGFLFAIMIRKHYWHFVGESRDTEHPAVCRTALPTISYILKMLIIPWLRITYSSWYTFDNVPSIGRAFR